MGIGRRFPVGRVDSGVFDFNKSLSPISWTNFSSTATVFV